MLLSIPSLCLGAYNFRLPYKNCKLQRKEADLRMKHPKFYGLRLNPFLVVGQEMGLQVGFRRRNGPVQVISITLRARIRRAAPSPSQTACAWRFRIDRACAILRLLVLYEASIIITVIIANPSNIIQSRYVSTFSRPLPLPYFPWRPRFYIHSDALSTVAACSSNFR